jgi:hypothetical protein
VLRDREQKRLQSNCFEPHGSTDRMSKRSRYAVAGLAAVLVVVVIAAWVSLRRPQERKEFVGQVDPATGYRCRFLLSTAWKPQDISFDEKLPPDIAFTLTPSPIRQWINTRLLHKAAPYPLMIQLTRLRTHNKNKSAWHIVEGYPEYLPNPAFTTTHQHLHIDSYPTTRGRWEWKQPGRTMVYGTFLFVYIPEKSTGYILGATYENAAELAVIDQEMNAIIASFHIEKVPSGGKR